jgi:gentisate 1,2-dioxygenase
MENTPDGSGGPVVLVGEATEDWTGDARFHEYSTAADPLAVGAITPVPVRRFPPSIHRGGPSRTVPLDLSQELGVPSPASSPALLASFVVLMAGEEVATPAESTSELYYCVRGTGRSQVDRTWPTVGPHSTRLAWTAGDFFTLPGGCSTVHAADPSGDALLYQVTDAPLLRYLGVGPAVERFAPTLFDGSVARARLAEVEREPDAAGRSRVSVLLGSASTPQTLTVTHTLWTMLGVLPTGTVQRPHRHQSAALDLIVDCAPGCYSLVGDRLGADGAIVDPQRVEWQSEGAFVTPPGLWHSHHNESGRPAYLVPVQDAGLHTYLRSLDIRFSPPGG